MEHRRQESKGLDRSMGKSKEWATARANARTGTGLSSKVKVPGKSMGQCKSLSKAQADSGTWENERAWTRARAWDGLWARK